MYLQCSDFIPNAVGSWRDNLTLRLCTYSTAKRPDVLGFEFTDTLIAQTDICAAAMGGEEYYTDFFL